jgi:iron(III) transport system permease protein
MRRLKLPLEETLIYSAATVAVVILVLYPIFGLLREALLEVEGSVFGSFFGVLRERRVLLATWNTLQLASGTTLVATITGTSLAVIVSRTNTPLNRYMESLGTLPLLTMPFVGGIAWTLLAAPNAGFLNATVRSLFSLKSETGPINIYNMAGLIWVMGLYYSPYVFILTTGALRSVDSSLEEAARLGGARTWQVIRYVTVPVVRPAIVAGALLSFSLSAGQFSIPLVIGLPAHIEVLPTVIYSLAQTYPLDLAELSGIGMVLLALTSSALIVQRYLVRRSVYETITGKGSRSAPLDLGRWRYVTLAVVAGYVLAALVLPFLALLYASFLRYSTTDIRLDLLTLSNYQHVLAARVTLRSFRNSAILSVSAATICMVLGLVFSYAINRTRIWARAFMRFLVMVPLGVPSIVLAVGVLAAWIRPPVVLYGTLLVMIVAYAGHFLPTATQSAGAGLVQIHRELEEAARVSGANWLTSMRCMVVPLVQRSLLGGWFLLLIGMFREMSASVLLYTSHREVVSVALLNLWEGGSYNAVAAFSTMVVTMSVILFIILQMLSDRRGTVLE